MYETTITVTCPACSSQFRVKATSAGKQIRCPRCGKPIQIPPNTTEEKP